MTNYKYRTAPRSEQPLDQGMVILYFVVPNDVSLSDNVLCHEVRYLRYLVHSLLSILVLWSHTVTTVVRVMTLLNYSPCKTYSAGLLAL